MRSAVAREQLNRRSSTAQACPRYTPAHAQKRTIVHTRGAKRALFKLHRAGVISAAFITTAIGCCNAVLGTVNTQTIPAPEFPTQRHPPERCPSKCKEQRPPCGRRRAVSRTSLAMGKEKEVDRRSASASSNLSPQDGSQSREAQQQRSPSCSSQCHPALAKH